MTALTPDRARLIVDRFPDAPVAILGDVMLDQFVVGRVHRISPEAPVPVLEHDHDEFRAGGAANVAHNVRALRGEVTLVGVVGRDRSAERLADELARHGLGTDGLVVDASRPTTRKMRIVAQRNQQVARVDFEADGEVESPVEEALADRLVRLAGRARVVVVSDYLKGTITQGLMSRVVAASRANGVPVLVDPKIPHIAYYAGSSLITPNHVEAETATHRRIRSNEDAAAAARVFRERASCQAVLITRGEHGMCLLGDGDALHLPTVAREVADVTGAGDTVIGVVALALAAGATLAEAAQIANHAAGVVVAKFGPATLSRDELLATFD